jgi:hypothetical protein
MSVKRILNDIFMEQTRCSDSKRVPPTLVSKNPREKKRGVLVMLPEQSARRRGSNWRSALPLGENSPGN